MEIVSKTPEVEQVTPHECFPGTRTSKRCWWGGQRSRQAEGIKENKEEREDAVAEAMSPPYPPHNHVFTPLPSHPHITHLPSVLPHRRVQILGRCWVSYSVTTKQNHLKTKWAGECASAIRALSLCGHREKWPLRIKGMEDRQGEADHFYPQVALLSKHADSPLCPTYTHSFKNAQR